MVIVYHGQVQEIIDQMGELKKTLDKKYTEILGSENALKVAQVAERVLGPKSFSNNKNELERLVNQDTPTEVQPSNKLLILIPGYKSLDKNGRIQSRKVNTSPLFYVTSEAFKLSGTSSFTDKQIASYIHEYDHFIFYALQKNPFYIASAFLQDKLNSKKIPVEPFSYLEQLESEDLPIEEKGERMLLALQSFVNENSHESATRILDKVVLESIGIEAQIEWRHKEKSYTPLPIPSPATGRQKIALLSTGGDPFKDMSDKDAINAFINWESHYRTTITEPYFTNLMDSMQEIKISKVYIEDFMKTISRKGKKMKRK